MFDSIVKRGRIVLALFLVIAGLPSFCYAFGISAPYLENNTIKVNAGNEYTYPLTIQNGDVEDYYVSLEYSSTKNIVNVKETTHLVPSNTYNNTFYFDISIPSKAKIEDKYLLEYTVKYSKTNTSEADTGFEIPGQINILVTNENATLASTKKIVDIKKGVWQSINKYVLIIIILALIFLIINRIWYMSKRTSSKLSNERVTNYTISQAINLGEVQKLLEKISDEEFRLPEIRNLFKEKIAELTTHHLTKDMKDMSRKEIIRAIDNIR